MSSCSYFEKRLEEKDVVARVHETYLYLSDLAVVVPEAVSAEDSIIFVSNYIDTWVRQQLLLYKAEKNIENYEKRIGKQLESYKNSLIIFAYEQEVIKQKLDTSVSIAEIKSYYTNNSQNFELKRNILKFDFIKLNKESPKLKKVKKWFRNYPDKDGFELEDYCHQYAISFSLQDSSWYFFDDVIKELPIETYNQEVFLRYKKYFELEDSLHYYYVHINDFKIKENASPLIMEKQKIKSIIVNQRKLELLKRMGATVYDEAVHNNYFDIYIDVTQQQ
ncbi:MAG: hypothetical protein COC01_00515 [Bacteroidetes bacterium]|nr:MAG: hypothetical protein COC01_00515 [Bacteroidota bacterium]